MNKTILVGGTICALFASKAIAQVEFGQAEEGPSSFMINHYVDKDFNHNIVPVLFSSDVRNYKNIALAAQVNKEGLENFGIAHFNEFGDLKANIFGWVGKSNSIDLALSYPIDKWVVDFSSHIEKNESFISSMISRSLGKNFRLGAALTYDGNLNPGGAVTYHHKDYKFFIEAYAGKGYANLRTVFTFGNTKRNYNSIRK